MYIYLSAFPHRICRAAAKHTGEEVDVVADAAVLGNARRAGGAVVAGAAAGRLVACQPIPLRLG